MSVRFEAANVEYAQKTGVAFTDTAFTVGLYFNLASLPSAGNFASIFSLQRTSPDFTGTGIYVNSAGKLGVWDHNSGNSTFGATTLSTATWYYAWLRTDNTGASNATIYLNGSTSSEATRIAGIAGTANVTFSFGAERTAGDPADVSIVNAKFWRADLAASNANTEKDTFTVINTTNNLSAWQLDVFTDLTDGPGTNDLTATGTLSNGASNPFGGGGGGGGVRLLGGGLTLRSRTLGRLVQYHQQPELSLDAYRRSRERAHREFLAKVERRAA